MQDPQVLVAGAGPVGQFAALALARRGVSVEIADTGIWPCKHSYALALHPQTIRLLEGYGLQNEILAEAYPVRTIGLYDKSGRRGGIRLGDPADPTACLAVVRQDFIENMLERALAARDVKIQWRHEVAELTPGAGSVTVFLNKLEKESRGYVVAHNEWVVAKTTESQVPYVIGADGYNSRVRRRLGIEFPEVGPAQYFAVFEFQTKADLGHEMRLVFDEDGMSVLWPLPNGYCRWSFELPDYHDTDSEMIKDRLFTAGLGYFPTERPKEREAPSELGHPAVLSETSLRNLLAERAPWFLSTVDHITWRTIVRFERRLTSSFGMGHCWLAGDAAHTTGPAGIQSMNIGMFEADELAAALATGAPGALDAYNARWTQAWRQLHGLESPLHPGPTADPWIAQHAAALTSCLPAHGEDLATLAGQLGLRF
ncbi:MAG TPA: NAD(P)/FAD-dependent oxidoreductase [Paludibaculum sp.]|jgi:NADPH-dependent dioxygenase